MMRTRLTKDEAKSKFDHLSEDEAKLFQEIAAYCDSCAAKNIRIGRLDVRKKFGLGTDLAVKLMRIRDGLRAEDPRFSNEPPKIPFAFAALASDTLAQIGRTEKEFAVAFAKAVADEKERTRSEFEPLLTSLRAAHEDLSGRLHDAEGMQAELADELTETKSIASRLIGSNTDLMHENAKMKQDLADVDSALESLRAHAMALTKEIIDVRTLNVAIAGRENELMHERDLLKAEVKAKNEANFDLMRSNSSLKQELDVLSTRLKMSEASQREAEQKNASEIAALVNAVHSLTSTLSVEKPCMRL